MTRARIDLLSPPFSGHLHPVIGMAQALNSKYLVRVVTTPQGAIRVRAAGIDSVSMLEGWEERLNEIVETPTAIGSHPGRLLSQLSRSLKIHQQVRAELEELYRLSRPDLLIADFTLIAVGPVASAYGIPWWTSLPSPSVLESRDGPPSYIGGLRPWKGRIGRLRDLLGWALIRSFKHLVARGLRKDLRLIGLTGMYRSNGTETVYSDQLILALGWRALEFRPVWPATVCFVPPFVSSVGIEREPPGFVAGKRHILVTLGTHLRWIKDRVAAATQQLAKRRPHIEFHFSNGDITGYTHSTQGNFQRLAYIDYRLLGRYDLVIHHAGAGVMAHCLAAGRRAVVFPVDFDQFDNAARLQHAGLAHRLRHLDDLMQTIDCALADNAMQERCEEFARSYRPEEAGTVLLAQVAQLLDTK